MKQIEFIVEIDKLKSIYRQTTLMDETRHENDAEHSWHLAVLAMLLSEYANKKEINVMHVMKMVIIHDLVEIDAGDTFAFDYEGNKDKEEREEAAAERIFGILPEDQRDEVYGIWREFEDRLTPEAKFAAALDRIQPLLHNYYTKGGTWKRHHVTLDRVLKRFECIKEGSEELAKFVEDVIKESVEKGYINK